MTLQAFVLNQSFPCIMARALALNGHIEQHHVNLNPKYMQLETFLQIFYRFIDHYQQNEKILHSLAFSFSSSHFKVFEEFETFFWSFLTELKLLDQKKYQHDPRVSADPRNSHFSFSLKEEAFFILLLHPDSPRLSRRYEQPTIVFNPHQQFEDLRKSGKYEKIRDAIRDKDKLLQGYPNPMLNDFGKESEIYQYVGRIYQRNEDINF